jgi:microcystin degradation protein MlrC
MRSCVLFGGIWHETNSFCPVATDLDAFRRFALVEGEALLSAYQGTNTEIGGFVAEAKQQDFELIPTLFAGAIPSGLVSRALRGNISPPLVDAADVMIGYDTLPHVDMAERGREAAQILRRLLDGEPRPHKAFRKLPMLTVPQMQGTEAEPMREIMAELHGIERRRDIVTASVAPGFPYTDVPHLGMAVLAYGDGADLAVERLAELIWSRREQFRPHLLPPDEAVRRAMAEPRGPVFLTEPADNGGGAPGDGTTLLAAMIAARAQGTVVMWDPLAAALATSAGVGQRFSGEIGGRTLSLHGPPVAIAGRVAFAGDVAYQRDAAYMTGQHVDLGLVATVEMEGIKVVLTSERAMPFDTLHLRCAGIVPEGERIINLKCGSNWRAAFGTMAAAQYYVDTPGICSSNIERVPLTRLRGAYFPLA